MNIYDGLKDFAGPVATIIASTVAGVFAYRQWLTARLQADVALNKLKFETFKERRDVFDAANEMIAFLPRLSPSPEDRTKKFIECRNRMRTAEFYFGDDVVSIIDKIIVKAADLDSLQIMAGPLHPNERLQWNIMQGKLAVDLANLSAMLPKMFAPYLGLYLLKQNRIEFLYQNSAIYQYATAFGLLLVIFALALVAVLI